MLLKDILFVFFNNCIACFTACCASGYCTLICLLHNVIVFLFHVIAADNLASTSVLVLIDVLITVQKQFQDVFSDQLCLHEHTCIL